MTSTFAELPIIPEIQSALRSLGYETPTPIQSGAIPPLLEGRDLLGCAQTGTGKTAAFAIPILQQLQQTGARANPFEPLALVLAPTRELVVQISENITEIGKNTRIRQTRIYGGVGQRPQVAALTRGVHILIATPGRLLDLIDQQYCSLAQLKHFVLDEADRMLDMGFMPDIQRIVKHLPRKRQSIFLSATMPPPIESLASSLLHQHVTVMVAPPATTAERVEQSVMYVNKGDKRKLLDHLLADESRKRILVFMRTKHGADRMYKSLMQSGVSAEGIHGGRSQNARQRVLTMFRNGEIRVLIATDVAARGIDIDDISHVINYEVPLDPDSYVHRIGRTARAGAAGESITFCDGEEYEYFQEIEQQIGKAIRVDRDHPFHSTSAEDDELRQVAEHFARRQPRAKSASSGRSSPRSRSATSSRSSAPSRGSSESRKSSRSSESSGPNKRERSNTMGKSFGQSSASTEPRSRSEKPAGERRESNRSGEAGARGSSSSSSGASRSRDGFGASSSSEPSGEGRRRRSLSGKIRKIKPKTATKSYGPRSGGPKKKKRR